MSTYDLIPDEAYESLPDDPLDKFVALVSIAQGNLQRMADDSQSGNFIEELRSQFMAVIVGTADALGVTGLPSTHPTFEYSEYQTFQVHLAGIVAKVRLQKNLVAKPHSVELGHVSRAKIRQEVDQLRTYIASADLTDAKRTALNDKLDELLIELDHRRLSFARTMAIAASIMGVVGGSAGAIAAAPKIPAGIAYIMGIIGQDKDKEDLEVKRLAPPPRAIPAPAARVVPFGGFADDLDDDVPF